MNISMGFFYYGDKYCPYKSIWPISERSNNPHTELLHQSSLVVMSGGFKGTGPPELSIFFYYIFYT